jgi:predicted metal-dependent HD superfamily phosphohydrolase
MHQWRSPPNDDVYSKLLAAYSESHRHYHTAHHIDDCLARFDEASSIASMPKEVEIALWFHDAIYRPISSTNELRSADWAVSFLQSIGATDDECDRVHRYVLVTKHAAESVAGDAALVVDIDLSILGRGPDLYDDFERAIREEYKWVPGRIYRRKRIEILRSILDRSAVYETEHFRTRYERQARENLHRAIHSLRQDH